MTSIFQSNTGETLAKQTGEANQTEYSPTTRVDDYAENLCQLFFQLVRTNNTAQLDRLRYQYTTSVSALLTSLKSEGITQLRLQECRQYLQMYFTLILQTRDIKGGKGEWLLSYNLVAGLLEISPNHPEAFELAVSAVSLMTGFRRELNQTVSWYSYGSWKDLKYILKYVNNDLRVDRYVYDRFESRLLDMTCQQIRYDVNSNQPSLCAKWIPRERSAFGFIFRLLAVRYSHHIIQTATNTSSVIKAKLKCYKIFRRVITELNKRLDTPQIKQCSSRWNEINFDTGVTNTTLMKNWRAFMNKKQDLSDRESNSDRRECASNLVEAMEGRSTFSKNTTVEVGKLIQSYAKLLDSGNDVDRDGFLETIFMLDQQWKDIVNSVPDIGEIIPLVDLSQSVSSDMPNAYYTAIGIGLLAAYKSKIGNRLILYSHKAEWINCPEDFSIFDIIRKIIKTPFNTSSRLNEAIDMIVSVCQMDNMSPSDVKKLGIMIVSDMQNPHVTENCYSLHNSIAVRFRMAGAEICKEWDCPRVIYWNIRATSGFPAYSQDKNVTMIGGHNHTQLSLLKSGKGVINNNAICPASSVAHILSSPRYFECQIYFGSIFPHV